MLREILGVGQNEPQTQRRWFHDEYFDLFVWQENSGDIASFQLCYGIDSSERALVWKRDDGFFHDGVDVDALEADEVIGARLAPDAPVTIDPVTARFDAAARALPDEIRATIIDRIREYAAKRPKIPARRKRFRRAEWQQQKPETR